MLKFILFISFNIIQPYIPRGFFSMINKKIQIYCDLNELIRVFSIEILIIYFSFTLSSENLIILLLIIFLVYQNKPK